MDKKDQIQIDHVKDINLMEKEMSSVNIFDIIQDENKVYELDNNFKDKDLIIFIEDITMKLYEHIKDDYIHYNIDTIKVDEMEYAKHKMNVLLDICRDSNRIKKKSKIYSFTGIQQSNPILYSRYITTLYSIYFDYIKILKEHKDYDNHKDKILHLYSGMKTIPKTTDSQIIINHPIDTTLRPTCSFIDSNNDYYLHFHVKLDGLIIPIIGSCYAKWASYDLAEYSTSEYEILYIGACKLDYSYFGNIETVYPYSYDINLRMHYQKNDRKLETLLSDCIKEDCNLECVLIKIPQIFNTLEINKLLTKLYDYTKINNFFTSKDIELQELHGIYDLKESMHLLLNTLFLNNIKNNYINNNEHFNNFLNDMKYIFDLYDNQYYKIRKKNKTEYYSIFKQNIKILIALCNEYPATTIRELCKSKFLNQHILIHNTFIPIYLEIYDTECKTKDSLQQIIIQNEYRYKYLKYKNKYLKLFGSKNHISL